MPIRARLRRVFGRSSQDSNNSTLTKSPTKTSTTSSRKSKNSSVYQPGEKMPPLKYRRPVSPTHKANLEAFNWAKAWRRKSDQSTYSPMGSRMPSRKSSFASSKYGGRRSFGGRPGSTTGGRGMSVKSGDYYDGEGSAVDSGVGVSVGIGVGEDVFREGSEEENDVMNVGGLSRQHTRDSIPNSKRPVGPRRSHSVKSASSRYRSSSSKDKLFDVEDLDIALRRSHLTAPKEERESDGSGRQSPKAELTKTRTLD